MKVDSVRRFIALRESLQKEKAKLEAQLVQINQALANDGSSVPPPATRPKAKKRIRQKNKLSLKNAVIAATKGKPLGKAEILAEVQKRGYRFSKSTANPMNSLNTVLYSNRQFKNVKGKFSPA